MDTKQLAADIEAKKLLVKSCKKQLRQAESDLAEAEEPKLRKGDYGTKSMLRFVVVAINDRVVTFLWEGVCDKNQWETEWDLSDINDFFVFLGNIFDDLKAMAEDLTEFTMDGDAKGQKVVVGQTVQPVDSIYIRTEHTQDEGEDFLLLHLNLSNFSAFILNLRRMEATLKRKQNG